MIYFVNRPHEDYNKIDLVIHEKVFGQEIAKEACYTSRHHLYLIINVFRIKNKIVCLFLCLWDHCCLMFTTHLVFPI